jgi:ribosomal protein L36
MCNACEPGTVCFNGKQTDCLPGTYSNGTGKFLAICTVLLQVWIKIMNSWAGIVLLAILHLTVAFQSALAHKLQLWLFWLFVCIFFVFFQVFRVSCALLVVTTISRVLRHVRVVPRDTRVRMRRTGVVRVICVSGQKKELFHSVVNARLASLLVNVSWT